MFLKSRFAFVLIIILAWLYITVNAQSEQEASYECSVQSYNPEIIDSDFGNVSISATERGQKYKVKGFVTEITRNSAVVNWRIPTCYHKVILSIPWSKGDDGVNTGTTLLSSCQEPPNGSDQDEQCEMPSKTLSTFVGNLVTFTPYQIEFRQRVNDDEKWSLPMHVTFTTAEDVPLKGPEVLPGAFSVTSCSPNVNSVNITLRWKGQNATILRGLLTNYSILVEGNWNVLNENWSNKTNQEIQLTLTNSTQDVCKDLRTKAEICSFTKVGRSENCTVLAIHLAKALERSQDLSFRFNGSGIIVNQIPSAADTITLYYVDGNDDLVHWEFVDVENLVLPFFVAVDDLNALNGTEVFQFFGLSADCRFSKCQSTGMQRVYRSSSTTQIFIQQVTVSNSHITDPIFVVGITLISLLILAAIFGIALYFGVKKLRNTSSAVMPQKRPGITPLKCDDVGNFDYNFPDPDSPDNPQLTLINQAPSAYLNASTDSGTSSMSKKPYRKLPIRVHRLSGYGEYSSPYSNSSGYD